MYKNIKEAKAYDKEYYWQHKEEKLMKAKLWREKNKGRYKKQRHEYYEANKHKMVGNYKRWRDANIEKAREYDRKKRARMRKDPQYRLSQNIGRYIHRLLREGKQGKKWEEILGYTPKELIDCLESQFVDGMCWENYGKWHVDHIIPVSFFVFDSPCDVEFKMCWRLENLQPLWAKDNLRKSAKVA